jgi:hypothetical protein
MAARRLVTMSEYARMRGCTHQAVSKAAKAGRISLIDGRIDPEVADLQWARNTSPEQQQRGAPGQFELTQQRAQEALHGAQTAANPSLPTEGTDEADSPALVREKSETERVRRDLLTLELAEKRGELVRVADVERAYAAKLAAAREAIEALPDRLASQLAAIDDPAKVHLLLTDELRLAMGRLVSEAPAGVN